MVERIGGADHDAKGVYSIFHPLHEAYSAVSFRPELTVKGYPCLEHNPKAPHETIVRDEAVRPHSLTMRAWGGQSSSTGDFSYVERPHESRARGGTCHGGLLLAPPRFELADYYGVTVNDVSDVASSRATSSYVLAAPGVAFALGLPTSAGALAPNSIVVQQDVAAAAKPLVVTHDAVEVFRAYSSGTETHFAIGGTTAVQVPSGTDAQRPATPSVGHVRVNTQATPVIEYWDGGAWVTTGGGGGAPTAAQYIVAALDGSLSAERLATATGRISWDFATVGQAKADIVALSITDAYVAAANKDGVAGTASLRTLGSGAQQACSGTDARLTDDRTASGIRTASTVVAVSAATAPTVGQALIATSSTAATWQTLAGAGIELHTARALVAMRI